MRQLLALVGIAVIVLLLSQPGEGQAQSSGRNVTVLSSSLRTADTNSADLANDGVNLNVRGLYLTIDVTAVLTTPLVTPSIQYKDTVSGKYENLLTASAGLSGIGTYTYLVYPGAGAASGDVTQVAAFVLPQTWRVSMDHGDTDPITYTVGAALLP